MIKKLARFQIVHLLLFLFMFSFCNQPITFTSITFKRKTPKNPNVSVAELRDNWISNEAIVYIGKGKSLKTRLSSYLRFGEGKFATHWGGRYIWQLKDSRELIVCWKTMDEDPRVVEEKMIAKFKEEHGGRRPFANLID